ncbi:hypothetical protein ACROYT_G021683 [Oculina patagonica]
MINRRIYMDYQKGKNLSKEDIDDKLNVYAKMLAGSKDMFNNESRKSHNEVFYRFSGYLRAPPNIYLKADLHGTILSHATCLRQSYDMTWGAFHSTKSSGNSEQGKCQPEKLENTVPFATGIFRKLKPEFWVEWKAPLEVIKNLKSPYSTNCTSNRKLEMFKDSRYKYSKPACLMQCLSRFVIKTCGCRPVEYEDLEVPICAPNDSVLCMFPAYRTFGSSEEKDECEEDCTQPCEHIEYETSLSYAGLQRNVFIQNLNSSVNITKDFPFYEHFLKMTVPEKMAYIDDNIISLDIYFQDMSYDEIEQTPVFQGWTLIANLGGNFGLFLGMSILTILEFVEFAFRKILFLICKQ